jgi:hypothetical protein
LFVSTPLYGVGDVICGGLNGKRTGLAFVRKLHEKTRAGDGAGFENPKIREGLSGATAAVYGEAEDTEAGESGVGGGLGDG